MSFLKNVSKSKELRKKILLVFFILFLYKIGTHVPVPGVNAKVLEQLTSQSGALGLMNIISGGALQNFSIFAVGIMPYITASIIVQLLSMDVVPTLTEWSKQGELGKRKTKRITYVIAFFATIVQSLGMAFGFNKLYPGLVENEGWVAYALITSFLVLGSAILIIFSEMIDKKGIGKGMSIIISAGILMAIPSAASMYYVSTFQNSETLFIDIVKTALLLLVLLAILVGVIIFHKATRRIPIQYPKQFMGPQKSFLPIKINSANVMPVIFAVAFFMTPITIAQFFPTSEVANWIVQNVNYTQPIGMAIYAFIIILFTYFFAFVQTSPEKMADNLQKNGAYVPGIRPGKDTEKYISNVLLRLTTVGSFALAFIAVIPMIIGNITSLPMQIQIGGISIIILVSTILDTVDQIKTNVTKKSFNSFIK